MPLEVHLVTPEREAWSGPAQMVIAHGVDGEVGILSGHAPLLIRLAVGPLRIQSEDGSWDAAVVDGGFLHVTSAGDVTRVDVLASQAQMASEVDRAAAEARAAELQGRLGGEDDAAVRAELNRALARANLPA